MMWVKFFDGCNTYRKLIQIIDILHRTRKLQNLCEIGGETSALHEYSQAMAEYLEHTRALAWLSVQNGHLSVAAEHRQEMLSLLWMQVKGAHAIRNACSKIPIRDSGDSTLAIYQGEIVAAIMVIMECERGIEGMHGASIINS